MDQEKKYELSLKYLDFSGVGYSVKTDYLSISGNYLTCDTATSGKWITGAPDDVQGKWSTDFYRSSSFKDSPYVKTTLNIDGSSIGESNDMYNAQYKMTAEGANVGINSGLSYKKNW
ncbi:hypothetical protein [Secundilactobacillus odoratitofui]|uniref:hypothetical protein n=1 Tax=Secundilactobacillus odoratitofui TaxID=480930 RepID=UPI0006CFD102|nr:hypothetical protein [Secundilactobacillus odoratitofui]